MALVLSNRVQESATANTTVSFTLTGAVSGFQTFAAIGNTNTTYYSATDAGGNWEVGLGTYSTTGPTLTRTTVYESSNSGSAVTFSGVVSVFVTYPSGRSVNLDASGNVSALGTVSSGTWQGSTVGVAYGGTGVTASTGPNSVVLRDADGNVKGINNVEVGLTLTTSAGATTTLTAASTQIQVLTGTANQTYRLPDATTLQAGAFYTFGNSSTGVLTVTDNAGAVIETITQGGAAQVLCLSSATVGGTWGFRAFASSNTTWGNAILDYSGVITSAEWNGDTVAPAYGGTGLTTFAGANNALYSTGASTLTAGTLPVAAGGTGLTTYTLNGVVYASGTGTLATGSALTFDGTNLINSGAYTAPSNGAGAGTKTTIRGSTGTGQANATGGNGFIEIIGGGGTSLWTNFTIGANQRRRGGVYLQAGTAQADAGGTYVNGSTINIVGSAGTNNGTSVGAGSQVFITSGLTTKTDGQTNTAASINLASSTSSNGSSVAVTAGNFNSAAGINRGSCVVFASGTATTGGSITLTPGNAAISGSTVGKAYVKNPATGTDYEILTTNRIVAGTNVTVTNCSGFLTIAASGGGGACATPTVAGIVYGKTSIPCFGGQVALGQAAGNVGQGIYGVAIGHLAGSACQQQNGIAIGYSAGYSIQGCYAIAIGINSATSCQGQQAIAIGPNAGQSFQGAFAIAIGANAGSSCQHPNSIVINATSAALNSTGPCQTHIGPIRNVCSPSGLQGLFYDACTQEMVRGTAGGGGACPATPTVAGVMFGETSTTGGRVSLGINTTIGPCSINSVAIGANANVCCGNDYSIGILGLVVGCCSSNSIAIGFISGAACGGDNVAIGYNATAFTGSIAIGKFAYAFGGNNIVINATGSCLTASSPSTFHVKPIRNASGPYQLYYCCSTGEITYN